MNDDAGSEVCWDITGKGDVCFPEPQLLPHLLFFISGYQEITSHWSATLGMLDTVWMPLLSSPRRESSVR